MCPQLGGGLGRALKLRELPAIGFFGQIIMQCLAVDIPKSVKFGEDVTLVHNCYGTVMHPSVSIEDGATIYHNVTLGRKYPYGPFGGIIVGKRAMIAAGAKILAGAEAIVIGEGAVVAANAVLTHSIGPYEVWGGIPAKRIAILDPKDERFYMVSEKDNVLPTGS